MSLNGRLTPMPTACRLTKRYVTWSKAGVLTCFIYEISENLKISLPEWNGKSSLLIFSLYVHLKIVYYTLKVISIKSFLNNANVERLWLDS